MVGLHTAWVKPSIPIVAIIEDDETERYLLSQQMRDWGYQPETFEGVYKDVSTLLYEITARKSDFVICDNHLQQAGYAGFFGTDAVVALYKAKIPSILVTQHQDSDDSRLKKWRPWLPVILDKDDIDQEKVALAFDKCIAEVKNAKPAADRCPYRVLVDIDAVRDNEIIAFVDAWNPHTSVSFPRHLIAHLGHISEGTFLLAEVNIGTIHRRELFFNNFKLAPKPDPNDGLA